MTSSIDDLAGPQDQLAVQDGERADLLATLAEHRGFLRYTVQGLSDEQAMLRPTASELCLGGLIKHVAFVEERWAGFIERGAAAMSGGETAMQDHLATFAVEPGQSLQGLLDFYQAIGERTDELVRSLPSLDLSHALPERPWFPPGARWSARRVLLHIIAETSQHAGHADIIRESIDGQKTMG
jgi:hypothetical protein